MAANKFEPRTLDPIPLHSDVRFKFDRSAVLRASGRSFASGWSGERSGGFERQTNGELARWFELSPN